MCLICFIHPFNKCNETKITAALLFRSLCLCYCERRPGPDGGRRNNIEK